MKINKGIYVNGDQVAYLVITERENHKYKWVPCLALLDKNGSWMYTGYWRSNSIKKAHKELTELGWKKVRKVWTDEDINTSEYCTTPIDVQKAMIQILNALEQGIITHEDIRQATRKNNERKR